MNYREDDPDGAGEAPMLTLNCVPVDYFDSLDCLGVVGGMMRVLLWRWTKVAGVWVREPVRELIRPERATADIRRAVDRAEHKPQVFHGIDLH